jgi:hypothetical protein
MTSNLLLVAWPNGEEIVHSFRYVTLVTISNYRHFELRLLTLPCVVVMRHLRYMMAMLQPPQCTQTSTLHIGHGLSDARTASHGPMVDLT